MHHKDLSDLHHLFLQKLLPRPAEFSHRLPVDMQHLFSDCLQFRLLMRPVLNTTDGRHLDLTSHYRKQQPPLHTVYTHCQAVLHEPVQSVLLHPYCRIRKQHPFSHLRFRLDKFLQNTACLHCQ